MTEPALAAENVGVRRGDRTILADVSVAFEPGTRTLIRGPSGAGKTTLFSILGLLDSPDEGRVVVGGTDAATASERARSRLRRDAIGFVFQDFQLVPDLTARENALLPQTHGGETDEAWIDELLDLLDVADRAESVPAELSGGEKQRVAIARALANRPDVVLADEPTGQLDPETTDRVVSLLAEVQERTDVALVAISHDPALEPAFDRTIELRDGRLQGGSDREGA